jgi:hypothetical protein
VPAEPRDEDTGGAPELERYEQLRARALSGAPDGWRLGLAMLERRGMAAWARAWRTTAPASPRPSRPVVEAPADPAQIVAVLATMALACVASG